MQRVKDRSRAFLFDIDNTLTPPRSVIEPKHYLTFINFVHNNCVYLVTGSDLPKATEQITDYFIKNVNGVFTCTGNEYYSQGIKSYTKDFLYDKSLIDDLNYLARTTKYPHHIFHTQIEYRNGMLNFSTVGRGADKENRKKYFEWDKKNKERIATIDYLKARHPDLDFCIGGEISIDIFQKGAGKSQAVSYLRMLSFKEIIFFGDKIYPLGNDYSAALEIEKHKVGRYHSVKSPEETFEILINQYS